jgi:hypothetical protein
MRAREWSGRTSWWLSGSATVLVHATVMFALPQPPSARPGATPNLVWLSSISTGAATEVPLAGGESRDLAPRGGAISQVGPRRSATHTRPRRQRTVHAPEAALPAAPVAVAAEPLGERPLPASPSAANGTDGTLSALPDARSADMHVLGASSATRVGDPSARPGALSAASSGSDGPSRGRAVRSRRPTLLAVRNPCSGYFPSSASADHAEVRITVSVDAAGHAHAREILVERPVGQEFGRAAAACAAALRFVPALDELGTPVDGDAKLELHFDRS